MPSRFLKGQQVTVRLTEKHELAGDLLDHPAKFVRTLPGQDWAEVELEEEHAGGKKSLHVPLEAIEEVK